MKKRIVVFLTMAVFIIPLCIAEDSFYMKKELDLSLNITSFVSIVPTEDDYILKNVTASLFFYPKDDFRQKVVQVETSPAASENNNAMDFNWVEPAGKNLTMSLKSVVRSKNKLVIVQSKVYFPLKSVPDELEVYTEPTEMIDSENTEIIKKASEIAAGETDLYSVVFNLASWTNKNVKYDLFYGSKVKKASWVLENKRGTCDEYTILFIAMCRSLGIPAKYSGGVAYSNLQLLNGFGSHAWAEVYFPGVGWIPFDTTYGEYGFLDATHIKLKESGDVLASATKYSWTGRDVSILTDGFEIKAGVEKEGEPLEPLVSLNTNILKSNVRFGSYNLIEVEVKNIYDYYVPVDISVSDSEGLTIEGDNTKQALLEPFEAKKLYWITKVSNNLNADYTYTFSIIISTARGTTAEAEFSSSPDDEFYSHDYINSILINRREEAIKTYSQNVYLNCTAETSEFYSYENTAVNCMLKNTGNTMLTGLKACLEGSCTTLDLGIAQEKTLAFPVNFTTPGRKDLNIIVSNQQVSKLGELSITVLDKPEMNIVDLAYPKNVSYNEKYKVSFTINKTSFSEPQGIDVVVEQGIQKKEWSISSIKNTKDFIINLNSKDLDAGENKFTITIKYEDKNKQQYLTQETFAVSLTNLTASQRVMTYFNKFGKGLSTLDLKALIFVAFVFGIVIGYIFNKKTLTLPKKKKLYKLRRKVVYYGKKIYK